jgi:hypothetical protein
MANPEIKFPCPVRRLSVSWRDGEWTIENEIRIESMTLPKSAELPRDTKKRGVTGFWYEAADRQGRTIYRQLLEDPFSGMEVFDRDGKMRRIQMEPHQASLQILVPDVPEVEELHIYSSTIPSAHGKEMREQSNAERIATLNLRGEKGGDYGR